VPYSVALVGCGLAAELFHVPALIAQAALLQVRWVVDPRSDRRRLIAAALPGEPEQLDDPAALDTGARQPDLVVVATPTATHAPLLTTRFLDAAVLCEKPVASRTTDARAALQRRAGATPPGGPVAVAHSELFRPAVVQLLARLKAGAIGTPRAVTAGHHLTAPPAHVPERLPWRLAPDGGGVLADLAYHLVYLSAAVLGQPTTVTGATFITPQGSAVEHSATLRVAGGDGATGTIETSWLANEPRWWFGVEGTHGALRVDDYRQLTACGPDGRWSPVPVDEPPGGHYGAIYAAAAAGLDVGRAPGIPADEGLRVLAVLDSARAAAQRKG